MTESESNMLRYVRNMVGLSEWVHAMDNRELLWRLCEEMDPILEQGDPMTQTLWSRMEDILYPEYDGDKIQRTATGWKTPEGEINYP